MRMRSRRWGALVVFLAALCGVGITASLGMWQIDRARQKESMAQERHHREAQDELDARLLDAEVWQKDKQGEMLHRRIRVTGQWLEQHTVYLENRQMHGRPGFLVLTPLRLEGRQTVILVQRGWVPRHFLDRTALPAIQTPSGAVTLQGRLAPWPSRIYDFGGQDQGPIRQNLDHLAYRLQTGLDLSESSLLQTDADSEGLQRAWPDVASGVEKHRGYALQWFALSGLIALLYVWFQIVRPRRKRPLS